MSSVDEDKCPKARLMHNTDESRGKEGRMERGLTLIKLSAQPAGRGSITQAKTLH